MLLQDEASVTVFGCQVFEQNKAVYGSVALLSDRSRLSAINSNFNNNGGGSEPGIGATGVGGTTQCEEGGVLALQDSSVAALTGCTFKLNQANSRGGAISASSSQATLVVSRCVFDNGAAARGSAVYLETPNFAFESTRVSKNKATMYGGIYMVRYNRSTSSLLNVTFSNNLAMFAGAGEPCCSAHWARCARFRLAGVFWAPKDSVDWLNEPPLNSSALLLFFESNQADPVTNGYGKDYASFKYENTGLIPL
jgi:predicted outer membrane repeat protein